MSIGLPTLETKSNVVALKNNMKMVVGTIKEIRQAIEVAKADKRFDKTVAINQLQENLQHMFDWGKNLQEQLKIIETRNEMSLLHSHSSV